LRRERRPLARWHPHGDPRRKGWNRRLDFASDCRRNQNGLENCWNQVESLYACERDQRLELETMDTQSFLKASSSRCNSSVSS
jgi:hypothetical protein